MQSIAYLPASNGAANASLATVQNVRSAGATTILVNTVTGISPKFTGTMGTPHTFTDPVTSEVITVVSEATAVDFYGSVSGGNLNIDAIAPGYTDAGSKVGDIVIIRPITEWANNLKNILAQSHNDDGTLKTTAITYNPNIADYISSGGVWSVLTGLNATMTALTGWQGGLLGTIATLASRTYTASKDTYVDVLRTTVGSVTTFSLVYTEVANNAAAPALAVNSIRLAKVVTSGSAVTSVVQFGKDSLNNTFYPNGAVGGNQLDSSDLSVNMKTAQNTVLSNPAGSGETDLATVGLTLSFTVPKTTTCMAELSLAIASISDFEFHPRIYLNGTLIWEQTATAAPGFTATRATQRTIKGMLTLQPGVNTITGRVFCSSGSGTQMSIGASFISGIVLGKVTA